MICLINLSATLWHHTKSPRMGERVGRKTKQYKISGARSTWKPMRNETRNSYCLILDGVCCTINPFQHVLVQRGLIPQLTQIKHNSLLGTEKRLLRTRTNTKQKPMICLTNLSATLWHHTKSPRMGRKTKQHKISGARSTWKLWNCETQNSYGLILHSVFYAINSYKHMLVQVGLNSPSTPPDTGKTQFAFGHRERFIKNANQQ